MMKTKKLWRMVLASLIPLFFTACDKDWYDSVPGGKEGLFARANTVRFYYVDGNGNGLIFPNDSTSFPVSCLKITDNPPNPGNILHLEFSVAYSSAFHYNMYQDRVVYDEEEGMYCYSTHAPGDERFSNYVFYVYFDGVYDTMDVTYRYTNKGIIGGDWYAEIFSWKFNGKHIYSDDDGNDKKVFVRKYNGKTVISFKK